MKSNRNVHAVKYGMEIVRYDRAGKWFAEFNDGTRINISCKDAAETAVKNGLTIFLGVPGGTKFDRKVSILRNKSKHSS